MTLDASSGSRHSKADYTDFEHVGPGTLAGRYLRRFWQPLYRAEDLAGRMVEHIGKPAPWGDVPRNGTERAAGMLAELL